MHDDVVSNADDACQQLLIAAAVAVALPPLYQTFQMWLNVARYLRIYIYYPLSGVEVKRDYGKQQTYANKKITKTKPKISSAACLHKG